MQGRVEGRDKVASQGRPTDDVCPSLPSQKSKVEKRQLSAPELGNRNARRLGRQRLIALKLLLF